MGKCFGDGHIFWLDRNLFLLSLGFFLIFSGFQTSAFIVNPVLKTFTGESSLGFYGLAIIYIVNPLSTPLTPVLSESWGPKTLMLVAAAIYCMYVAGIIHPNPIMFLVFAGVCGFGSSSIWTAHGKYLLMLPRASEGYPQTIFFILFQCCLIFGGVAVYVITVLQEGDGASTPTNGGSQFSESLATDMYIFLTAACVVGTLVLLFLADLGKEERQGNLNNAGEAPPVPRAARSRRNLGPQRSQVELVDPSPLLTAHQLEEGHDTAVVAPQPPAVRQPSFGPGGAEGGRRLILAEVVRRVSLIEMDFDLVTTPQPAMQQPKTIKQLFIDTMVVFKHPLIAMSLVLYTYTGVERSWWQTNYAHLLANETSVHLTESWNNKKFIGIAAAFTGVGQIVGGLLTRVFLHHWNKPRVDSDVPGAEQPEARKRLSSNAVLLGAVVVVHVVALALTWVCFLEDLFNSMPIGCLGCVLYGAADNTVVIVIYTIQKQVLPKESHSAAVAAFKCMQSIGSAAAFLYATAIPLEYQIGIMLAMLLLGSLLAAVAERKYSNTQ